MTAGLSMDMGSLTYTKNLPNLVKEGKITGAQLDAAVLPILAIKIQLGLFEHPYLDESKVDATLDRSEGLALTRKLAARSMALLKNDTSTLPLKGAPGKIAVIGPLADSATDIEGGWTVEGLFGDAGKSHPITVLAGIRKRLGDAQVVHVGGPMPQKIFPGFIDVVTGKKPVPPPSEEEIADTLSKVKSASAEADLVIAVLGETAGMNGEAASRATLDLPGIQLKMLETAAASGKPVVVVLLNGRPLDLRPVLPHARAILEAWYPGTEGGNAIADVLFGDVNPGGKLPVSWPRAAGQEPLYYNHTRTHLPDDEKDFTSRYWDLDSKPLYPFGYGLSYTKFQFTNLRLSRASIRAGEATEVAVDVKNTGAVAGDAVTQVYIHQQSGSASRPVRELKGFRRVTLKPGETQTLKFALGKEELEFWSPQTRKWVVEPSAFDVWVGEDSTATLHADLRVTAQ
jgi:beta-glucosidase